jgi:tetratricopeptide (TPR) repeat protein
MERIDKLKAFILRDPADLFSRHALALELLKIDDYHGAIDAMEELLGIDERHIGTYLHLGKAYSQVEQFSKALSVMKRGLAIAEAMQANHEARELKAAIAFLEEEME